ncbi:MAG TPA: CBS domain-containing protein [archaeon]|nr:CBS domain-containing protein [archaeon]
MQPAVAVSSLAHAPPVVSGDARIPKVIEAMQAKGRGYALVAEGDRIVGIVTPKRMLKLLGEKRKGAYVNVSGLQGEDDFLKELVNKEIERHLRVVGQKLPVDQLVLHVRTYAHGGKRKEYEVKARLITEKGFFFAQAVAWDLTKSMQRALGSIEREVLKATGKRVARGRGARQRAAQGP